MDHNEIGPFLKIGIVIMALAIVLGVYVKKSHRSMVVEESQTYGIKSVRVLTHNDFEFVADDGSKIHGYLRGDSVPEAKPEIIRLMNSAIKGRIVVVGTRNGTAGEASVVDVFLTVKETGDICPKEMSLWEWLQQKKLAYQPAGKQ
jgi:hypothetical protein